MKKIFMLFTVAIIGLTLNANEADLFPRAQKGFKKHIINLEQKDDESKFKIEIAFAKEKLIDCNLHSFIDGNLTKKSLEGYGYSYYEFTKKSDEMRSTMMLCNEPKSKKMVYYPTTIEDRYNSNLPLIIYAPKDVIIEVKIFKEIDKYISKN